MPSPDPLSKTYAPSTFEEKQSRRWETAQAFEPHGAPSAPRFSIAIAPPNVTGKIHIGHALENSLADVIVRWKRMQGFRTVWVPGTDHAGIATQMVVERALAKEGIDRLKMGRDAFVEKVWEWKRESKKSIQNQLNRLGCSLDWTRERFTLDEGLSRAVRKVFVDLYRDGLVYRGRYVVNWCPRCGTAVSDLEVHHVETQGKLYFIKYDVEGDSVGAIVATTRPETMLGDTALAISPGDPRTRRLVGKTAILPILGRHIPVVEDGFVDREFGSGIVKITPAHDPNDFACANRHGLPSVTVIGPDGRMTPEAGPYSGLDRFEARSRVLETLAAENRIVDVQEHVHSVGHCQRCDTVIEPYLSNQWFVKVQPLAEPAIRAVEQGAVRFVPENWTKTYFEWMRNIHDWCISRQLWWGHRIPAYYCDRDHVIVAETAPSACDQCGSTTLTQDNDVLDTWFSSQLWPFSVFGWPEDTPDLKAFYPTDLIISGFDILFFWDARMIMAGLRFTGKPPFSVLHLHGLVRDEKGEKMSKTRGNVIDPLDVIAEFGADAVRFTLLSLASPGRDLPLAKSRMSGSRAFLTKLWNATRFVLSQAEGGSVGPIPEGPLSILDRGVLTRLHRTVEAVARHLEEFRFDLAASSLYDFVWRDFCDRHLEMVKPLLSGKTGSDADREASRSVLFACLRTAVAMLHPFVPFLTEEIWERIGDGSLLAVSKFPVADPRFRDDASAETVRLVAEILTRVRTFRSERGAAPTEPVELRIAPPAPREDDLRELFPVIASLGRLSSLEFSELRKDDFRDVVGGASVGLKFARKEGGADPAGVRRELEKLDSDIQALSERLQNSAYLSKAPEGIVQKSRERLFEMEKRRAALGGTSR
ncbi:MAG: valine--tRNA ligase [Thermoanaerobaculia bacterium]